MSDEEVPQPVRALSDAVAREPPEACAQSLAARNGAERSGQSSACTLAERARCWSRRCPNALNPFPSRPALQRGVTSPPPLATPRSGTTSPTSSLGCSARQANRMARCACMLTSQPQPQSITRSHPAPQLSGLESTLTPQPASQCITRPHAHSSTLSASAPLQGTLTYPPPTQEEDEDEKPGDVYVGSLVEGVREGRGKYTWSNGCYHEGDYATGQKSGAGVLTFPQGGKYTGEKGRGEVARQVAWHAKLRSGVSITQHVAQCLASLSALLFMCARGFRRLPERRYSGQGQVGVRKRRRIRRCVCRRRQARSGLLPLQGVRLPVRGRV